MKKLGKEITGADNWAGTQLRKKRNRENKIAQRARRLQHVAINVQGVGKRMESVKGNADRQQNVEMGRLIDDPDAGNQPLEILEQKISVLKKAEHAQIHANAGHEPTFPGARIVRFADLPAEPEIHRRRR